MAILASVAGIILSVMTIIAALSRYGTDMKFGMNVAVIVWYAITIMALFRAIYIYAQISKYLQLVSSSETRNELAVSSCQSRNQYVSPPTYDQVASGTAGHITTDVDKDNDSTLPGQSNVLPPTYASIEAFSKYTPNDDEAK
ncbi:uncharacterized protein TRIADDRAFT_57408 [Trichoplax adhaerens]|uniref:Uncharacterized protein n=1 Tax=Trichoplax adhaerens TaxID=10228 RepID=B3RZD1_TRIAD|nr:predicted protein [Trichoplax adhaerens]EDV23824.1 predicted protein [Trichoplax adhaerens]|eukprot:XP_002113350.1 predicted protein [Trichoplax adhaerens]